MLPESILGGPEAGGNAAIAAAANAGRKKIAVSPSGDTTGATDYAAIMAAYSAAVSSGTAVADRLAIELLPGAYYVNQTPVFDRTVQMVGAGPRFVSIKQVYASGGRACLKILPTLEQWRGGHIRGILFDGNENNDGLILDATAPLVITQSRFDDLYIQDTRDALVVTGHAANEVYQCQFRNIQCKDYSRYGLYVDSVVYNEFANISNVSTIADAIGFRVVATYCEFRNMQSDGVNNTFNVPGGVLQGFSVETIAAEPASPSTAIALNIDAMSVVNAVTLTSIDPARCAYGIKTTATGISINGFLQNGSDRAGYGFWPASGSSGTIKNATGLTTYVKVEAIAADAEMRAWTFENCPAITDINDPVTYGSALPTATSKWRGRRFHVVAANGVSDHLHVCIKNAADAYAWAQLD